MIRKIASLTIISFVILSLISSPVYALLTNPTSISFGSYTTNTIKVFRNLVEPGDSLFTFQYNIQFTSDNYSTTPASDTIFFKLYNSANVLKATFSPYVFPYFGTNGYGNGIAGVYFSASDDAPVWGSAAKLEMACWPSYFSGAPSFTYNLVSSDYVTETTQQDNQDALKLLILLWCDRLDSIYEPTGIVLKQSSDAGEVLSPNGETYFQGALPGLAAMCPSLFYIQVYVPEVLPVSYNMTMANYYEGRAVDSHWYAGFTNLGEGMGVSGMVMATLVFAAVSIIICIWCIKKDWGIEAGAGISTFIGIAGALLMGSVLFAIMMIISLLAVVGLVWLIALKRVS